MNRVFYNAVFISSIVDT